MQLYVYLSKEMLTFSRKLYKGVESHQKRKAKDMLIKRYEKNIIISIIKDTYNSIERKTQVKP